MMHPMDHTSSSKLRSLTASGATKFWGLQKVFICSSSYSTLVASPKPPGTEERREGTQLLGVGHLWLQTAASGLTIENQTPKSLFWEPFYFAGPGWLPTALYTALLESRARAVRWLSGQRCMPLRQMAGVDPGTHTVQGLNRLLKVTSYPHPSRK